MAKLKRPSLCAAEILTKPSLTSLASLASLSGDESFRNCPANHHGRNRRMKLLIRDPLRAEVGDYPQQTYAIESLLQLSCKLAMLINIISDDAVRQPIFPK
jgi:hypothetical protein